MCCGSQKSLTGSEIRACQEVLFFRHSRISLPDNGFRDPQNILNLFNFTFFFLLIFTHIPTYTAGLF